MSSFRGDRDLGGANQVTGDHDTDDEIMGGGAKVAIKLTPINQALGLGPCEEGEAKVEATEMQALVGEGVWEISAHQGQRACFHTIIDIPSKIVRDPLCLSRQGGLLPHQNW